MFEQVDPRDATPLYAQIASRLRLAIAAAELKPGTGLPSVRQLAGQLRINPATVVQAYRELEAEGFVEMRQGRAPLCATSRQRLGSGQRAAQARTLVHRMLAEGGRQG